MHASARKLWARVKVHEWPAPLVLFSFASDRFAAVAGAVAACPDPFLSLVRERDEVSVAVPAAEAPRFRALAPRAESGPYAAVTLDLDVDLAVSGFLLPAAEALAAAGISIVPQCAFLKDHVLVHDADAARTVAILEGLAREARMQETTA